MDKIVDLHADDYGYTLNTSKGMLECMKKGTLNSISLITNTSFYDASVELLLKEIPNLPFLPEINVHLNFVEGFASNKDFEVIAKDGILNLSWGKILFKSFGSSRKKLKEELKQEIKAQIEKSNIAIEKCMEVAHKNNIPFAQKGIRIDSHTHTHPIPVVWKAIVEVIEENNYNIVLIRNPKEPLLIFLKRFDLYKTYRPINFVKNIILNIFSHKIDRYCDKKKLPKMYMWGLVMSGAMDYDRVSLLLDSMVSKAKKDNRMLEILGHPGKATKDELVKELSEVNMKEFNLKKDRNIEKNMFMTLKEQGR